MKKQTIYILLFIVVAVIAMLITGNLKTDVLRIYSEKSLTQIVSKFKYILKENKNSFSLSVDDKNKLIVKKDFSSKEDMIMELDAKPFTDQGLNKQNLPQGYKLENDKLIIPTDFKNGKADSFIKSFFLAVDNKRDKLSYHKDLDHYGLSLYNSNKFEFAKNYKINDKDIVFVLAAEPFKEIGINVNKIDGWIFKTIIQTDKTKVDVLLKPYDLDIKE